jgi:hypothetical protein
MKILRFIDQSLEIREDFGDFLESWAISEIKKYYWMARGTPFCTGRPTYQIHSHLGALLPGKVITQDEV